MPPPEPDSPSGPGQRRTVTANTVDMTSCRPATIAKAQRQPTPDTTVAVTISGETAAPTP
jgi:hypothetical protein